MSINLLTKKKSNKTKLDIFVQLFLCIRNKLANFVFKETNMKVLKVYNERGDYGALSFANQHGGVSVNDVIANPDKFLPTADSDEYENWNFEVKEFNCLPSKEFLQFIRNDMMDYDSTKHEYFYVEGETV